MADDIKNKKISAEEVRLAKDAADVIAKQLKLVEKLHDYEMKKASQQQKNLSFAQKKIDLLEKEIELAESNLEYIEGGEEALRKSIDSLQGQLQDLTKTKEEHREINEEILKKQALLEKGVELFKKENEELIAQKESMLEIESAAGSITKEIQGMIGATEEWRKGIFGALIGAKEQGHSFSDVLKKVGENLKSNEFLASAWHSVMEKGQQILMAVSASTWNMAKAVDAAQSSVNLSTGAFGKYDDALNEIRISQLGMAVTAEQVGKAYNNLYNNVREFSQLSNAAAKEMTGFVTKMEAMGVSSETSSQAIQTAMAVIGETTQQAIKTQQELLGLADAIGDSPERIVAAFSASASSLAKHGDNMEGVFKRLSAAAKALNTDVQTLTGAFGSQMDTFEGAATAGAQLNALLGGQYIDTVKLLHADEEERVRMVLGAIETSGQQAALLENKFGRLAFASAAGISDVAEATKLLKAGTTGYDAMISKASAAAMSQKEMEERAKQAIDVGKKLASAMQALAIAMDPVVEVFKNMIDGFVELEASTQGWAAAIIGLVTMAGGALMTWYTVSTTQAIRKIALGGTEITQTKTLTVLKNAEAGARNKNASAMQREATAAKNQTRAGLTSVAGTAGMMAKAKAAMAYGAALALVGVGFLAVAHGVATLADAVKGMNLAEFMMTLGLAAGIGVGLFFFAKGILAVGAAGTLGAPGILAIGGAVALIGVGLAIPIAAMALLVDKLTEAGPAAIEAGTAFLLLSGGVTTLAAGMALMATFGAPGAMGLIVFAGGITAVALALKLMGDGLTSLGKMFEGLGKFAEAGGVAFTGMVQGIKDLAGAAKEISVEDLTGYAALATVTHQIAGAAEAFEKPEVKAGATRIKDTVGTRPVAGSAAGPPTVNLSAESAKILASEIVNSMKDSSGDWNFWLGLGDSSASDYMRMHNRMAQKSRK